MDPDGVCIHLHQPNVKFVGRVPHQNQSLPPYEVLDPILELYVEQDRTASEIIALGFDEALVRRISRLVDVNEYKRRQGPPGVRVSLKAFGKDRRLPITNAYRG